VIAGSKRHVVETELRRIWDERRRLTPDDVLDVAEHEGHPLHEFFEWDDTEASRLYRLGQAAGLIRSVKVTVTREKAGEVEDLVVRGWVSARSAGTDAGPGEYIPEADVRQRPEQREALLRQMRRDLNAFHRRYRHLSEYWELVDDLQAQRTKAS
jgi:hypothetical protein